ncbi:MAG TPA: DUF1559 domain-containing protein [Gemmataceae bacterium]|nr:DUF1559 domain-containing protein [Gemmataceae bacterium]
MRRAAARSQCANNLKRLGLAIHSYRDAQNYFPAGTVPNANLPPERRLSYHAVLLPYLEHKDVADKLDPTGAWDAASNVEALRSRTLGVFQCADWTGERWRPTEDLTNPYEGHRAITNYIGVAGLGPNAAVLPVDAPGIGMFGYDRCLKPEQVKDGMSNTAMLLETGRDVSPWPQGGPGTVRGVDPADQPLLGDGRAFGGTHFEDSNLVRRKKPTGSHVLLADGSYRFLRDEADPGILPALATVAGGESVPGDW